MWLIGILVSAEIIAVINENMYYNRILFFFYTKTIIKHIHNADHISK